MAQTGNTPISLFYSATPGSAPTSGNLGNGELAINTADGILFYKNPAGTVVPLSSSGGSLSWQAVQSSSFTAAAGNGYYVNTTSGAVTVTLPISPTAGQSIAIVDFAGTFATNNVTINPNGKNFLGATTNKKLATNREAIAIVYVDATQGWLIFDGFNASIPAATTYSASYLVVAGGGAGGLFGAGGAGGYLTNTFTATPGTTYTATVGAGGASSGAQGGNSTITGSGLTTVTSVGGGGGSSGSGGSGAGGLNNNAGGSGTVGQGNNGGTGATDATTYNSGGGGGGAGAVGGNSGGISTGIAGVGGVGASSSITGSAITYAGGGGGGGDARRSISGGTGGAGGGGNGGTSGTSYNGQNGTINLGGGGGGAGYTGSAFGSSGLGASGVVILSVPSANYSGTTTGSPTVTTSGSNTVIKFTASGSYTA